MGEFRVASVSKLLEICCIYIWQGIKTKLSLNFNYYLYCCNVSKCADSEEGRSGSFFMRAGKKVCI